MMPAKVKPNISRAIAETMAGTMLILNGVLHTILFIHKIALKSTENIHTSIGRIASNASILNRILFKVRPKLVQPFLAAV